MIAYLDTSVVLRTVLQEPEALDSWSRWDETYSSELLGVEARRNLDRMRLQAIFDDERLARAHIAFREIERSIQYLEVTRRVLDRAACPLPTVVKTLDAIHLVSAVMLAEHLSDEVIFASHDRQQTLAATALGFSCVG